MDEQEFKNLVAKNIAGYRRQANLTQMELAEKLNYSDKAISKWERAEALPDIYVLKQLAGIFNIAVDDLLNDKPVKKTGKQISVEKRVIIPIMVIVLVFLIATLVFGIMLMTPFNIPKIWLCFVYAIPVAAICSIVFSALWGKRLLTAAFVSLLVWSVALLLYLSVELQNKYIFFVIAAPGQVIIILWTLLFRFSKKYKNKKETEKNSIRNEPQQEEN